MMPTCEPSLTPYVDSGLYTVTPTRGWLDHYNLLGSNVEAPLLWRTGAHDGPCALEWVRLARAVASGRSAVIKRFYVSTVSLEPLGWRCRSARSRPSRWSSHPSSASRRCLFTATLREEPRLAAPSHAALVRSPQPQGRLGRPCVEPRRTLVPGGRRTAGVANCAIGTWTIAGCAGLVEAHVLVAPLAGSAGEVGADHAADADVVTRLELGDVRANGDHHTRHLMSRHHRPVLRDAEVLGRTDLQVGDRGKRGKRRCREV